MERENALWARMAENLQVAQRALSEAVREPFTTGSTGQLVEHPGFRVAARADELALKLYRALTAGQDELIESMGRELGPPAPGPTLSRVRPPQRHSQR